MLYEHVYFVYFLYTVISGDYDGALSTYSDISGIIHKDSHVTGGSKPFGAYSDISAQSDVTRVLLLMYLQVKNCVSLLFLALVFYAKDEIFTVKLLKTKCMYM